MSFIFKFLKKTLINILSCKKPAFLFHPQLLLADMFLSARSQQFSPNLMFHKVRLHIVKLENSSYVITSNQLQEGTSNQLQEEPARGNLGLEQLNSYCLVSIWHLQQI